MSVRLIQILSLLILISGCADTAAKRDSQGPSKTNRPDKPIPPLLPITIHDLLQLPDVAINDANGIGPGRRFWYLTLGNGSPDLYAEAYDDPFLTKLEVSFQTSDRRTSADGLKMIHNILCLLRPK